MKRFFEKISDLMFNFIFSDLICDFVLPMVIGVIPLVTALVMGLNLITFNNQAKYEFVTQDGEVKEGYGCKTNNGEGICIGDDGTKYFGVKSYKEITVQDAQEEVQETTNETKEYYLDDYLVIITFNDNYKDLDYETLKTHFKSNYNAKSVSIDDDDVAGTEIFCEKAEIDNIKQQLESDYLVQGYEILEFKID